MTDPQQDGKRIHRYRGRIAAMKRLAVIDRSNAVNLARTIRETDNIEDVTRKGWLSLVEAVLRMDETLRSIVAQDSEASPEYVGWRSIESAPQDGTTILLLVPTAWGKWNKTLPLAGWWEQRDPPMSGFWIIFNADEALQRVEPTHWMPLPAAPLC